MSAFEQLLTAWDGQQVAVRYDAEFAAWMFIGVHSTSSGRSGGGTRMAVYAAPEDGLADALKLSAAMTRKMAVCNVELGGGKAVLAVSTLPTGGARTELLHRYGDFIESLGGLYAAAPDVNTSEYDMDTIGERTAHVFCKSVGNGGSGSTAPATAVGVFHGLSASVRFALEREDLADVRVLVQGLGAVGSRLAQQLTEAGAEVVVSDLDAARVEASGLPSVDPADVIGTECDVYAPCALGGTIDTTTIDRLRCRVIAGAANNQLASPDLADELHARGILYAPDYVINAGGVLHGTGLELLDWDQAQLDAALRGLGDTLLELYADRAHSPVHAAEALVAARRAAGTPSGTAGS